MLNSLFPIFSSRENKRFPFFPLYSSSHKFQIRHRHRVDQMNGGATRVYVLCTTVPFQRAVALSVFVMVGWCFWCFFFFVWLGRWWVSWCVVGCLPAVVWFSWLSDYLIHFLSWLWWRLCLLATYVVMHRS